MTKISRQRERLFFKKFAMKEMQQSNEDWIKIDLIIKNI